MPAAVIEKAARAIATEPTPGWFLDREWRDETLARWRTLLGAHHKKHPLAAGLPKEELRSREAPGLPATVFDALLTAEKQISVTGDVVHLSAHRVALKQDEEEALAKIEGAFERAGLAVPGMDEVLASSGVELSRARNLLQILLRGKKLLKIGDGFAYVRSATERYDLIVLDLTDPGGPSEALYTPDFYRACAARLETGGAMTLHIASPVAHPARIRSTLASLRQAFAVVTPYLTSIPLYGGLWMMACASDSLDPRTLSAEEVDRRIAARSLRDLRYYNGDMHRAALALPNFVRDLVA